MFPFSIERQDRRALAIIAIIAALEVLALFAVAWKTADGHFMLPLDDSYIHLQYARQAAAGESLVYTHGMNPSGGMTSPLYVLLLTPLMLAGFTGAKGAFAAFIGGGVIWMLLNVWTFQLAKRLTSFTGGIIAAALLLSNGHVLWCALSGMETALFSVLLVGALLAAQVFWRTEERHARVMLVACLTLLPLARPEGALVSLAVIAVLLLRKGEHPRYAVPVVILALVPFVIWLMFLKFATGDWRPAGLVVKGLFGHPYVDGVDAISAISETLSAIALRFYGNEIPSTAYAGFKGFTHMPYVPIGLGGLALFGAAFGVTTEFRARRFGAHSLLAIVWIGGLLSLAASWIPFIQQQRYLAPWTILAILLAVVALRRLAQLFQQFEENAFAAAGIALVVFSLSSLGFWMAEYGRNSRDIYQLLRVSTFSLQDEKSPLAVTDAGVIAYYTNAPVYDLIGLCNAEFTHATLNGEGSILETLRTLPQNRRPVALIGYRQLFSEEFPLDDAEWTLSIPRTSITSGNTIGRYPIDWSRIDGADEPPLPPGSRILLEINVGDIASEALVGYRAAYGPYDRDINQWPQPLSPTMLITTAMTSATTESLSLAPCVEGARIVRGEEFLLAGPAISTREYSLVARVSLPPANSPILSNITALQVAVTSRQTGFVSLAEPADLQPGTDLLSIPLSDALDRAGGDSWRVNISAMPAGAAWMSGHYWIISKPKEHDDDH